MCGIICLIRYGTLPGSKTIENCHSKLIPRGPDKQNSLSVGTNPNVYLGFSRLSIMDISDDGLQPFQTPNNNYVICNGEIYNHEQLALEHSINMRTKCDCEVILPLYEKLGFVDMIKSLDAEFAMVIFDEFHQTLYVVRDRYGVRPLFYGWNKTTQTYGFASEMKALHDIMEWVEPVEPNKFFRFDLKANVIEQIAYYDYQSLGLSSIPVGEKREPRFSNRLEKSAVRTFFSPYPDTDIKLMINNLLTVAVKKRLCADRPVGFLLSGGLDSSLIVAIATRILGPDNITCFSIGLENSPDVIASKVVAKYLGIKNHHIILFDIDTGINAIPEVIKIIESYDITTIRASTPQYLMSKYIEENTNIKVLLSGEGSDEIHGSYRYFRDAPDPEQFHLETVRLLKELYMFDNLRTDRTMASSGLEVRVPFLDFAYVEFINKIDPQLLMYTPDRMEKQIIRDSFIGYLPDEILYRSKEAFSDAVSSTEVNWFKSIQTLASKTISQNDVENNPFEFNKPKLPDALYFRRIFNECYPGRDNVISHYWLPKFQKEIITDPSATILVSY